MCMASAYFDENGERELVLEDIAMIECDGKRIRIATLFGETKEIEGVIREVDFQNGAVILSRPS